MLYLVKTKHTTRLEMWEEDENIYTIVRLKKIIHRGNTPQTDIWCPRVDATTTTIAHIRDEVIAASCDEDELIAAALTEIL